MFTMITLVMEGIIDVGTTMFMRKEIKKKRKKYMQIFYIQIRK